MIVKFATKKIRQATASYRTTLLGIPILLAGVGSFISYLFGDGNVNFAGLMEHKDAIITALIGMGLIASKDNLTQSEDVEQ